MFQHLFSCIIVSFFLGACVHTSSLETPQNMSQLVILLVSLDEHISQSESMGLSKDIYEKTEALEKTFKMTSPPQWHNFLVNTGIREKGLCHHWSDTLYMYLSQKSYASFEFHLMGANIGKYWSEHNALLIVAKGENVKEGIIIDPWRGAGNVYFSTLKEDTSYHWKHREKRGCKRH